ncbi:MAG TPA: murein biosynthesis integral membrane protein MurJ [Nocardioides sp.]|uniref:murein biosynthesis integral membrane protein MurJ n=1 Tax=Nocardioides sp. TaxID=35761 RepID=UPI002BE4F2FF|nr:murein biosynthesis integral membrane protein MurJ [Nocardioides sp.]HQR28105.1 murein biosynthesis integral membrane protein MurJ [Nocardioides sp.]
MSDAEGADSQSKVLTATAVMAAGTVISRLSGFLRTALLVAALGQQLHADVFNIANTIPNMLYILLAGGVINAVLVPQLVRSMRNDADGGAAYTDRVITLAGLFLGLVTVLLVVAAPWVMNLFLDPEFARPELSAQRESVVAFARFCLPQVFFYGMYVLVGQILNAHRRFGPMMWAPIANNVISIGVLVVYLAVYGPATDLQGAFTPRQELLLGLGSTVGIVAQFAILLPYLAAVGYRYRPRFDFRDSGLGHTLRLGVWTVLFVIVNQLAYTVVVRLASSGTAQSAVEAVGQATGYTVYSQAFLIIMTPHSVITVSLATAILPMLSARAAEADLSRLSHTLMDTLRTALVLILPFAALLPLWATDLANLLWGHGAGRDDYRLYVPTLSLFGVGLVFFTVHYLMLRGFYALERTRTVFWIQCAVAATNIAAALLLVHRATPVRTAPALVLAYTASYAVGAALSFGVLRRQVGGLEGRVTVQFLVRTGLAVAAVVAVSALVSLALHRVVPEDPSWVLSGVLLGVLAVVAAATYLAAARALRLREVTTIVTMVAGRLRRRGRG